MRCPTNASWEADIIVVSANVLANEFNNTANQEGVYRQNRPYSRKYNR
jgi:hypothetical protein